MKQIKDSNFVVVQAWMITKLKLKGNDLLIYATIHGFCQDNETNFTGAMSYLQLWTSASKNTVRSSLRKLVELNYLEKIEVQFGNVTFHNYKALHIGGANFDPPVQNLCNECSEIECECANIEPEGVQKLNGRGAKIEPNSIVNNINDNIVNNISNKTMSEIEISDFEGKNDLKYFEVAKAFHSLFIKNLENKKISAKKIKETNAVKFIAQIRLMYERDECTDEQFRDVFKFLNSPKGEFWTTNILSTTKLREKFTTLLLQNGRKQASTQDDRSAAEKTESAVRNYYNDLAEGAKEGQRG